MQTHSSINSEGKAPGPVRTQLLSNCGRVITLKSLNTLRPCPRNWPPPQRQTQTRHDRKRVITLGSAGTQRHTNTTQQALISRQGRKRRALITRARPFLSADERVGVRSPLCAVGWMSAAGALAWKQGVQQVAVMHNNVPLHALKRLTFPTWARNWDIVNVSR